MSNTTDNNGNTKGDVEKDERKSRNHVRLVKRLKKLKKMPKHKRVGKYELFEKLGEGNFSKVKRAIDTETQIQYAIKIVDISSVAKEGMEKQVRNEISVLKQIKHPNVVQLKEVLKSANNIYIVMELITGGELFDKIVAARKFTEDVARRYFQQLIDGIAYCHANRIAHRDLKPENLLLDSHDNLKITDFGLSGMMKQGVMLETICGTPHYVAPVSICHHHHHLYIFIYFYFLFCYCCIIIIMYLYISL